MDVLSELFHYHGWATKALLVYCDSLPAGRIAEAVPGTQGPILPTFAHSIGAEWWMLSKVTGEAPAAGSGEPTFQSLAAQVELQQLAWERLLPGISAREFKLPAQRGSWPAVDQAEAMFAVQAIHHGELHRTEIRQTLSLLGVPFPGRDANDAWAYWAAAGRIEGEFS
jgi:hypothetical protein